MPDVRNEEARPGRVYPWYVLAVLVLVYVLNFIDRQIVVILAERIKADLKVTDAQLGFLYGTVFAVFFAVFAIPLGRLADAWDRRRLIAWGTAFWSLMTVLSGLARGFGPLAFARLGVGAGEASAAPAAYSLLSDWFPRERRGAVLGFFSSGIFIGAGLGLGIGGLIVDRWDAAFPAGAAPLGLHGWQARGFSRGRSAPRPPRLAGRVPRRGSSGPPPRAVGAHAPRASAGRLRRSARRPPPASLPALPGRDVLRDPSLHARHARARRSGAGGPRDQRRRRLGARGRRCGPDPAPRDGAPVDRARRRALLGLLVGAGAAVEEPGGFRPRLPEPVARPLEHRLRPRDVRNLLHEPVDRALLPARPPPRHRAGRPAPRRPDRRGRLAGRDVGGPPCGRMAQKDAPRPALRRCPDGGPRASARLHPAFAPFAVGGAPSEFSRGDPDRSLDRPGGVHRAGARTAAAQGHGIRRLHPPHDVPRTRPRSLRRGAPERLHRRPEVGPSPRVAGPGGRGGPPFPRRAANSPGVIPFPHEEKLRPRARRGAPRDHHPEGRDPREESVRRHEDLPRERHHGALPRQGSGDRQELPAVCERQVL